MTSDEPANHRLVNLPKAGEEARGTREDGQGKRHEGRGKRHEGRGKRHEARGMSEDEVEMVREKQISR